MGELTVLGPDQHGARQIAGTKDVVIAGASRPQEPLNLGLFGEVCVSSVLALFGEGVAYFGRLDPGTLMLDDPEMPGRRATHLCDRVRR